jgi:hypothetical protein
MRALVIAAACLAGLPALGVAPGPRSTEPVDSIPLRRGYYVASDTACSDASRATTMLFKGDGFGMNCETLSLERLAPTRYRLTDRCSDHQGGADLESTSIYEVSSDMAFTLHGEDGSRYAARFCRQEQMPEPFSTNDISDVLKVPPPPPPAPTDQPADPPAG